MPITNQEQDTKDLFHRFLREVVNPGAPERMEEFVAPEYIDHSSDAHGPSGYRDNHLKILAAFPDFHVEIEHLIAGGDTLAFHLTYSGTHSGEFRSIPATLKKVSWTAMQFRRVENGKFVESWGVSDTDGLLELLRVESSE
ncbi:MAG: ester cyclase [Chloroflexi bacterium]|nr:ester cyclase [Chloroflexota bacterium]